MSATTVRISEGSHQALKELANRTGDSMGEVLTKALEAYRRKLFFEQMNAGYAALQSDSKAWAEHQSDLKDWDAVLLDGLDRELKSPQGARRPNPLATSKKPRARIHR